MATPVYKGLEAIECLLMEESTITLGIDLHYFMDDEQRHEMDASIHNKCEASMIQVLNHLGELFGEDIQIDVSA